MQPGVLVVGHNARGDMLGEPCTQIMDRSSHCGWKVVASSSSHLSPHDWWSVSGRPLRKTPSGQGGLHPGLERCLKEGPNLGIDMLGLVWGR